ncbi:hypothetical protein NH8B_1000 [Pseudogulbenkiania sp. NH8B]|uniref:hypothetical protein n=1 Tax=Pseudogulbenkiania sp. (strain NH8B) TaxID=748280 RepID=UPI0002279B03|nr:hypothetical protein [Pseudogulbenkiania sp. NH8B]BAK75832.1 hypothetical protein NH8B_1000 [Pseudogulbenkiania sp. NH8B]
MDALKSYGRIFLTVLIAAALVGAYWLGGHRQRQADEIDRLSQQNAAVAEALQIERRAASLGQVLAAGEQARTTAREAQTKIVTSEVVRYVEREKAQAAAGGAVVRLDADWVRGHDLAAAVPAETGAEPVLAGEAGPATAGEALEAVAGNYAQCQRWRDQVIGWQEWWRGAPDG